MTQALCLACGKRKFGALAPCPHCGAGVIGSVDLQLLFSDHSIDVRTLDAFGAAIQALQAHADTPHMHLKLLLRWLSTRHADLIAVDLPEAELPALDALLQRAAPPLVMRQGSRRPAAPGIKDRPEGSP